MIRVAIVVVLLLTEIALLMACAYSVGKYKAYEECLKDLKELEKEFNEED